MEYGKGFIKNACPTLSNDALGSLQGLGDANANVADWLFDPLKHVDTCELGGPIWEQNYASPGKMTDTQKKMLFDEAIAQRKYNFADRIWPMFVLSGSPQLHRNLGWVDAMSVIEVTAY